jgi:hypothetical protein
MPTSLHEGNQAIITGGPFTGKVGTVTRIDSDSATVVVDVFDRETPVDVDLGDVELHRPLVPAVILSRVCRCPPQDQRALSPKKPWARKRVPNADSLPAYGGTALGMALCGRGEEPGVQPPGGR